MNFLRTIRKGNKSASLALVVISLALLFFLFSAAQQKRFCADPHSAQDGGDCQAITGLRRPHWACYSAMRAEIPPFLRVYEQRPFKQNTGGMKMDHAFALWYTLRSVRPKVVIESGALNGQSTWLIRQTLPNARIFSLDPKLPKNVLQGVKYFTGDDFVDFAKVDWKKLRVVPKDTLVFVDDHQSAYRRVLTENPHGFYRFITEDNYGFGRGDNYSFKWICERRLNDEWPGWTPDNFGKWRTSTTWEQHLKHGELADKVISTYYEVPPIATTTITGQTRYVPGRTSVPIIKDRALFQKLFGTYDLKEFGQYTHFTYVELKPHLAGKNL